MIMENKGTKQPGKAAEERFARSDNCAQSVFTTFAVQYGMDESSALKITSPLGGGISRRGEVCGAVTGALLALGLVRGTDTPAGKEDAYRMGQEFMRHFEQKHGTILCRDLLGYDIGQPESRQQAHDAGVFKTLCPRFVHDAAEIVQEMLAASSK
jgi:C_GCAxxG_C_C family probable redox protein